MSLVSLCFHAPISPPKTGTTTLDNFITDALNLKNDTLEKKKGKKINWASHNHFAHRVKVMEDFENFNKFEGVTFMVTRNPLDRLLSCWYDKFSGLKEHEDNPINVSTNTKLSIVYC